MRRLVSLLLATVLIVACSAQPPGVSPAAKASDGVSVALTRAATLAPEETEAWTPAPAPDPTPTATPTATGDHAAYDAFIERASTQGDDALFAAMGQALDRRDWDALADASRDLRTVYLIFVDWLDANPPRTCYEPMWTITREGAKARAEALRYYKKWARSGKHADFVKFRDLTEIWGENVRRGTAMIFSIDCPE